jgi:hypothetical protein
MRGMGGGGERWVEEAKGCVSWQAGVQGSRHRLRMRSPCLRGTRGGGSNPLPNSPVVQQPSSPAVQGSPHCCIAAAPQGIMNEVELLRALRHRNIVTYIGAP